MNLSASTILLRPRTVAEIMDLSCRLTFTQSVGLNLKLSAVVLLPAYAGLLLCKYLLPLDWLQVWLIAIPLSVFLQAPFTIAASHLLFGDRLGVWAILKLFGRRMFSYAGALVFKAMLYAITACFIIGFFTTWPNGTLVTEASLLEGAGPSDAWSRSKRLVTQRASESFSALFSLLSASFAFVVGMELLGQALVTDVLQLGKPFGELWEHGGSPYALLGLFAAAPFVASARFIYYIDTRTRADGWDIQVKFMAILAAAQERAQARPGVAINAVGGRA